MSVSPFLFFMLLMSIPAGALIGHALYQRNRSHVQKSILLGIASSAVISLVMTMVFAFGTASQLADRELISGQVTEKTREHGHYQRPYECMCTPPDKDGHRTCQTCYEDRYTVEWTARTTIGNYTIEQLDRGSRRVYLTPDPQRYALINRGDPVAAEHYYKNYMKGVPKEYLYNDNMGASDELLAKIPSYPRTYDFYMVNRVLDLDGVLTTQDGIKYNKRIANELRTLGAEKEVNIILVVGKPEPNLIYAIRQKWEGGKKNDVIVALGLDGDVIKNVEILTWDKNHYFKNKLQSDLRDHGLINDAMLDVVFSNIRDNYTRPQMRDYEELREHVETQTWVMVTMIILFIGLVIGGVTLIKRARYF